MDQPQATNPPGMPGAAPQATQGAPGPEVSQPFSIPAGMTPEAAQARLAELKQDKEWGARWFKGGPSSREAREFDSLTRHAIGQQQPTVAREPTENERALAGLGRPPDITGYAPALLNIRGADGGFVRMDEATNKLATTELLPAAHGLELSSSDVSMVAFNVANPVSYEACDAALHRLWPGESFEQGLTDFRAALSGNPKARTLIEQYPETLGNSPMLISAVVAAFRRQQARQGR